MSDLGNVVIVMAGDPESGSVSDEALRGLVASVSGMALELTVLARPDYLDIVARRAEPVARSLLSLPEEDIGRTLDEFERRFPSHGACVAKQIALDLDVASRIAALRQLADTDARVDLLVRAMTDYGLTYWPDSRLPSPQPARFAALTPASGATIQYDRLVCVAAALDADVIKRGPRHREVGGLASVGVQDAHEVLRFVLDVGVPAVAGAIAAKIVDAVLAWSKDIVSDEAPQSARSASPSQVVKIFGPDGKVLQEVRIPSSAQTGGVDVTQRGTGPVQSAT